MKMFPESNKEYTKCYAVKQKMDDFKKVNYS